MEITHFDPDQDEEPRRPSRWDRFLLPPHIGWPLLVIGLLGMSLSFATHTVMEALADGGAQVVDETAVRQTQARWLVRAEWGEGEASGLTPLSLVISDAGGRAIEGAKGVVRVGDEIQIPFSPTDAPGRYRALIPSAQAGSAARIDAWRGPERFAAPLFR